MSPRRPTKSTPEVAPASHVANTVETIAAMYARAQHEVGPHVRRITRMSAALGRPPFLVVVVVLVFAWIALNLAAPLVGLPQVDRPPFAWLQGALSLSALLMTTVVLITQNRQGRHIEQRARLDLQINLLAEQKITKLIELLEELRHDMPNVKDRVDLVADEMKEPVDPDAMLSALEKKLEPPRASQSTLPVKVEPDASK
jgi:uncharacterized membrane protein